MNNYVFIIDTQKKPLMMATPRRARELLLQGKAAVFRRYPFTLILKNRVEEAKPSLELRIDPGSRFTGFALVTPKCQVVWSMELEHRSSQISQALTKRAGFRRSRRSRNTRYRKKRFNRSKPSGWLAPSLMHRVQTVETWIKRICRYAPVISIAIEKVKFDIQKMENPDIQGVEYQQGTLAGYTLREALLEHWGRKCAYCGIENVPLQIEHIKPKSKNGSDRFNNLTLACQCCNQVKGNRPVEEFLADKPDILKRIKTHCKKSLADAAAVRTQSVPVVEDDDLSLRLCATRNKIFEVARSCFGQEYSYPKADRENTGLTVKAGSGALAKLIRGKSNLPKAHWIDAACNSVDLKPVTLLTKQPLIVTCKGAEPKAQVASSDASTLRVVRNRQAVRCNSSGFPAITVKKDKQGKKVVTVVKPKQAYTHAKAGDIVRVILDKDRKHIKAGNYVSRVKTPQSRMAQSVARRDLHATACCAKGVEVKIDGHRVSSNLFNFVHRHDGYDYSFGTFI